MIYAAFILSYCLGSLSFAIIISKFMKMKDPRTYGSKNAGATNVMRSGNKKAAILTLLGDMIKGFIVVFIAKYYFDGVTKSGSSIVAICGILVVFGHIYPIFFRFKGGKGVATTIGVMLGFNFYLAALIVVTWFIVFKFSKTSSLSALIAAASAPLYAYLLMGNNSYFGATLIIAFFVLYNHKQNIIRIFNGQEHTFNKS